MYILISSKDEGIHLDKIYCICFHHSSIIDLILQLWHRDAVFWAIPQLSCHSKRNHPETDFQVGSPGRCFGRSWISTNASCGEFVARSADETAHFLGWANRNGGETCFHCGRIQENSLDLVRSVVTSGISEGSHFGKNQLFESLLLRTFCQAPQLLFVTGGSELQTLWLGRGMWYHDQAPQNV